MTQPATALITTVDPATGETLASYPCTDAAGLDAALSDAAAAGRQWRARALADRAAVIRTAADAVEHDGERLAAQLTAEMGKPLAAARAEVGKSVGALRYLAGAAQSALSDSHRSVDDQSGGVSARVRYEPLGVLIGVMPWNFPYWQSVRFFAPALLAGNTAIVKPAPATTGSALALNEALTRGGLPPGVLQTLPLTDDDVATAIADPRVQGVSLTGSARAGRSVAATAGANLKKVLLELGGADPFIVFPDANVAQAAKIAATARLQNNGQSCIAAKRFLVHEQVHDEFVAAFVAEVEAAVVGDPTDEAVTVGPLVNEAAVASVERQVADTIAAGAQLATGGSRLDRAGYFYAPTVLTGVTPDMPAGHEEVFGPVAAVSSFRDVDDAVEQANATDYGLGASVFTADAGLADELAARLETGQVFVNGMVASDPRFPFGGVKNSGFGRELGPEGFLEFVNAKLIRVMG